jgi:hypothetical protein
MLVQRQRTFATACHRAAVCIIGSALLASCSSANPVICTQAIVSPDTPASLAGGHTGYVQFTFEKRTLQGPLAPTAAEPTTSKSTYDQQCTAMFDYPALSPRSNIRVWTAAHCVGRNLSDLLRIKAYIHTPNGYHAVDIENDFVRLKGLAEQEMRRSFPGEESWRTFFTWNLALELDPANAPVCRSPIIGNKTYKSRPGMQDVCFSWSDLLVVDGRISSAQKDELSASFDFNTLDKALSFDTNDFFTSHARLTSLKREVTIAQSVDSTMDCRTLLKNRKPSTPYSALDCTEIQERAWTEVLSKHTLAGKDALLEAERRGLNRGKGTYAAHVRNQMSEERSRLLLLWSRIGQSVIAAAGETVLIKGDKASQSVKSISLKSLAAVPQYVLEPYGMRVYTASSEQESVAFGKGDSGSILLLKGLSPLLALQSVDNEETSGGASVIALPRRQTSLASTKSASTRAQSSDPSGPSSSSSAASTENPSASKAERRGGSGSGECG